MSATPAAAQTIIGNLGATAIGGGNVVSPSSHAVGFTMGASTQQLTNVKLVLQLATGAGLVVQLRADASGLPGAPVASFANPAFTTGSMQTYTFTPTAPFQLQPNTTYWLSAGNVASPAAATWFDGNSAAGGTATYLGRRQSTNSGTSWANLGVPNHPLFEVNGTAVASEAPAVPEPGAALLFLPALGTLVFLRRSRRA